MILCLETSGKTCSVALAHQGACIAYSESSEEWSHSKQITLMIRDLLQEVGKQMADLEAVAVSKGPGSYTGLRVGTSCAKGICYAQDIPLISVPTLEIIAAEVIESSIDKDCKLIPMIDARRQEVYCSIYDVQLKEEGETHNKILDDASFEAYSQQRLIFCGDGAHKMQYHAETRPSWTIRPSYAKASHMASKACLAFDSGKLEDVAYYIPFYLKPPNITKSKKSLF